MKRVLKVLLIITAIFALKLIYTFSINSLLIKDYNNEIYKVSLANMLYFLNINERYIAYYNNGNILFKNKEYGKAITAYESALNNNPTKNRICSIRINLALSHFYNINLDNTSTILKELNNIQNILYEDNCAIKGVDIGNSEKADKLDDEIEKLKEQFGEEEPEENGNGNEEPPEENNGNEEYQEIEEQIREQQRDANSERGDDLEYYENRGDTSYYDGKRW